MRISGTEALLLVVGGHTGGLRIRADSAAETLKGVRSGHLGGNLSALCGSLHLLVRGHRYADVGCGQEKVLFVGAFGYHTCVATSVERPL